MNAHTPIKQREQNAALALSELANVCRMVTHLEEMKTYLLARSQTGHEASTAEDLVWLDVLHTLSKISDLDGLQAQYDDLLAKHGYELVDGALVQSTDDDTVSIATIKRINARCEDLRKSREAKLGEEHAA